MYRKLLIIAWIAGILAATRSWGDGTAPARGTLKVLRLASPTDPMSLDPTMPNAILDFLLYPLLNLSLLDNQGTQIVASGAERWTASADHQTHTFYLRPGIKFSNGRLVTSVDYLYAMERAADPKTASVSAFHFRGITGFQDFVAARIQESEQARTNPALRAGRFLEPRHLAGLRALDDRTLVVELEQPNLLFPNVMTFCPGVALPGEEVERPGANFRERPITTGPYVVSEWVRGMRLILTPNPHYAGPEPRHFDRIEIMIGGDEFTHLMMFESGALDVASLLSLPISQVARLKKDPHWGSRLVRTPLYDSTFVALNMQVPPLDNTKVRQAINWAVNKPGKVFTSTGYFSSAKGIIPPTIPAYDPELVGFEFDPKKARQLLGESGVSLPIRNLTLGYAYENAWAAVMALGVQADLARVGVEIQVKGVSGNQLLEVALGTHDVPMALLSVMPMLPDPKEMMELSYDSRAHGAMNLSRYANPQVERLIDLASAETEIETRRQLYRQVERRIVLEAPCLWMGHQIHFSLRQPWLKGPLIDRAWPFRLDRVWKEE